MSSKLKEMDNGATNHLLNTLHDEQVRSLVVCGPSGVGKGTIINQLLQSYPSEFGLSVSHTSRLPRPGEVDGVHYHFVDRSFLEHDIASGPIKYVEHAEVHSNLYGTRQDAVDAVHKSGKVCVLDLDSSGVRQIKANNFPAKMLFIAPASYDVLEQRLRGRQTESEEQVRLRLHNARKEIKYGTHPGNFDAVLYNKQLDDSMRQLYKHLQLWFPQLDLQGIQSKPASIPHLK